MGLPGHDSHTASCLLQLYNSSESEAAAEYAGLQGRAGHTLTLRYVIFLGGGVIILLRGAGL